MRSDGGGWEAFRSAKGVSPFASQLRFFFYANKRFRLEIMNLGIGP
jgi:hypothetical protein